MIEERDPRPAPVAITLSSSDDDDDEVKDHEAASEGSDSDIQILSDEGQEFDSEDENQDQNNAGLHVDDKSNVPDQEGRILINVDHPEEDQPIFLSPNIARSVRPHQIGGIRFLYDNLIESAQQVRSSEGLGCILAHSMGLGKTVQIIALCDIFLGNTYGKHK